MPLWLQIVLPIVCLLGGLIGGFFIARAVFTKEIQKNPPINEAMIKAMYRSMGRTPSQAQINATMAAIKKAQNSSQKK